MRTWTVLTVALLAGCAGPRAGDTDPPLLPENAAALVGSWTARDADGSTCHLYLSERPQRSGRQAVDQVCLGGRLMQVRLWELRGDQLILHGPRPMLALAPAGEGRFAGAGVVLTRRSEQ